MLANVNRYLATLEQMKVIPNFWTSAEYLIKSEAIWTEHFDNDDSLFGFQVDSNEWLLPPIIHIQHLRPYYIISHLQSVFAGWPDLHLIGAQFLDYQFVYNPKDFQTMEGHQWQTFRKNVRKYPKRTSGTLRYERLQAEQFVPDISALLAFWAEHREVFDPDTFVRFLLHGDNRKGLFVDDTLVGVNVWDENYYYVNFRYCIDNGSPFLNEYMRYLFYTDEEIVQRNKLVNDGGSLGLESLHKFKLKLNPIQVLKIYSYPRKGESDVPNSTTRRIG